ncbi:MAG: hypothetical protein J6T27_03030 [Alphaproteobacteria bacterium]|nr:hypothetical protein [Alphaproteobacteria bacterium]
MNLWILTEDRPKINVLKQILEEFAKDHGVGAFVDNLRILPIVKNNQFVFTYELIGFRCNKVNKIYIKTVSGNSSFVDFLVFYQEKEPVETDKPLYAIEETKTDDSESRNTGVYQRCSKFVFLNNYYPSVKKIMLYNLQIDQKEEPTQTNIFGTRLLLTLGVNIRGKKLDKDIFVPFHNIDELIDFKNGMRRPPKGNVPIIINKYADRIEISGRLVKSDSLSHDPNIGALSIISNVLRVLGWKKDIIITEHGLIQKHVQNKDNKFILIANLLGISLKNLVIPVVKPKLDYWHYDMLGEKLGTIFIHLVVDSFTDGYSIFENHAGCEKGYFVTPGGEHIPLAKYEDRDAYKAGDKDKIIHIPDLVLVDPTNNEIINIEGKKYERRLYGIEELKGYDAVERDYIHRYYPKFSIVRTVVLYGSDNEKILEVEVGFLLNRKGHMILGIKAPKIFVKGINNLLDFWKN